MNAWIIRDNGHEFTSVGEWKAWRAEVTYAVIVDPETGKWTTHPIFR